MIRTLMDPPPYAFRPVRLQNNDLHAHDRLACAICLAASALPFAASAQSRLMKRHFRSRRHRHTNRNLTLQRPSTPSAASARRSSASALGINLADDVAARPRPARPQPEQLRPGPADLHPRHRRQLRIRHPRRARVSGRHPGLEPRRPGPGVPVQSRLRRASGNPARPVLRAVRQFIGRRDPAVHVRRQRPDPAAQLHWRTAASTPSAPA